MLSKLWKLIKKIFVEENLQLPGPLDEVAREAARLEVLGSAVEDLNGMRMALDNCVNRLSYLEERVTKLELEAGSESEKMKLLWALSEEVGNHSSDS